MNMPETDDHAVRDSITVVLLHAVLLLILVASVFGSMRLLFSWYADFDGAPYWRFLNVIDRLWFAHRSATISVLIFAMWADATIYYHLRTSGRRLGARRQAQIVSAVLVGINIIMLLLIWSKSLFGGWIVIGR